ncbi:MAG: acyl-CoA dehydrogenase [Deltaproteobacteria bacterium]|nr:acyl-CoA dehydrogenase [Deltaproteobacteria bacterium]
MFRIEERDVRFNLFEVLKADELLAFPAFKELDRDMFELILKNAFDLAKEVLAPVNAAGDRAGCRLDEKGKVVVPKEYHSAYRQISQGQWIGVSDPAEFGGMGAPEVIRLVAWEAFCGACCSLMMYPGLTQAAAAAIIARGNDEQRKVFAEKLLCGVWGGTMCLTEPQAGSAVGDVRTTAKKIRDGWYKIQGQKIFISSGDSDLVENTVHLVLARLPDAPAGIKGLSLFIVPRLRVNPDGSCGEFNDVAVSGIEHKMGIKGSATCSLAFGDNDKCEGWIIGREGEGIQHMFHMMNEARLGVGLLSLAVSAQAYNEALDYSRERVQGTDAREFKNANARRVPIIEHPDIKRMLLRQRAYVHGLRALMYRVAKLGDLARHHPDAAEREKSMALVELLTPICKGYGSDQALEITSLGVQVLGGYGYCQEYPLEQHMRDARIFSIYEGANGIQAIDLVGRKLGMKGGAVFMTFLGEMNGLIAQAKGVPALADCVAEIEKSVEDLQGIAMLFMGKNMSGELLYVLQHASPFLRYMGNTVMAWLLGEQAVLAAKKLDELAAAKGAATPEARKALVCDDGEAAFYDAKVKTARFFCKNLLPENRSLAQAILSEDTSVLDVTL